MESRTALLKKLTNLVAEAHISIHKADLLSYVRDVAFLLERALGPRDSSQPGGPGGRLP